MTSPAVIRLLNGHALAVGGDPWTLAAAIGAAQRNRVAARQLTAAGVTPGMLRTALCRGHLSRVSHGVLRLGADVPLDLGSETEALLTAPGLALAGLSVLRTHKLIPAELVKGVHVVGRARGRAGITVHHVNAPGRIRIVDGLPTTPVEHALLLAAVDLQRAGELESAVGEACAARATSRTKIRELAEASPRRPGVGALHRLVAGERDPALTRRWAARRALTLIRQARLPEPLTEVTLFGYPADFYWPQARLVLEVDSFAFHGLIRSNFNRDHRRDRIHRANGLEVCRVTADELAHEPTLFVGDLGMAIGRRIEQLARPGATQG